MPLTNTSTLTTHCINKDWNRFSTSAKYLGLTIKDDLDWGQHVSEISAKATKTFGFLRRNFAFAPRHTKEVVYKTFVRPKLEYAAHIWHPYHETQIGHLEKVQKTAANGTSAGDGETPVASAIYLTNLSGHSWRSAGSSLIFPILRGCVQSFVIFMSLNSIPS